MCDLNKIYKKINKYNYEEISALHEKCFEEKWSSNFFKECIENIQNMCVICEISNKLVGVLIYRTIACEAEIFTLFVHEQYRLKNIGCDLIQYMLCDNTCQIQNFFLEVNVNNQSAISLYKKNGFETISIRKKYYRSKNYEKSADAILMCYNVNIKNQTGFSNL